MIWKGDQSQLDREKLEHSFFSSFLSLFLTLFNDDKVRSISFRHYTRKIRRREMSFVLFFEYNAQSYTRGDLNAIAPTPRFYSYTANSVHIIMIGNKMSHTLHITYVHMLRHKIMFLHISQEFHFFSPRIYTVLIIYDLS